jgi:D-alanyl-lipoteichoic acid acyltransferase DltB (MBOAT superfamily)
LRRLALFVMLFPHLIAGPIVRHSEIMPQFDEDPLRPGVEERLARGIVLLILGILLKVVIADRLAGVADPLFAAAGSSVPSAADAWTATIAFALQIYFDFMAYSEMAIGLALMFGLRFPLNFDVPYRSTSLQEFWRRWHMTLSRFLRDYLYIALGGSREGTARLVVATIATMGLCGLWHGAGWTFVVWGLMHGLGLLVARAWGYLGRPLPAPVAWLATFVFVAVAFMLFRAPDFAVALRMGEGLVGAGGLGRLPAAGTLALMAIAMGLALLPRPNPVLVEAWLRPAAPLAAAVALLAMFLVLEVGDGQPASFIYFQF